jgi:predicted nucleotidyltransferase
MKKDQITNSIRHNFDEIKKKFRVKKLSVFGSVARDEATERSDVDILVEFEGTADFDSFMGLKIYLEDLLQAPVDLVTHKAVRPQLRQSIEDEAVHVA